MMAVLATAVVVVNSQISIRELSGPNKRYCFARLVRGHRDAG